MSELETLNYQPPLTKEARKEKELLKRLTFLPHSKDIRRPNKMHKENSDTI